jgi:hypothetical protein
MFKPFLLWQCKVLFQELLFWSWPCRPGLGWSLSGLLGMGRNGRIWPIWPDGRVAGMARRLKSRHLAAIMQLQNLLRHPGPCCKAGPGFF